MTLNEIYAEISAHMIKGIMIHEQLSNYYNFLGLKGYSKCHEYHYLQETMSHIKLNEYFLTHHNKLIPYRDIENPNVIPSAWFSHVRQDADTNTKTNGVRNGLTKWVEWERETKKLYEQMYKELLAIDEIASAAHIKELIHDVDEELKKAEGYHLNKEAIGYNISAIVGEQKRKYHKYKYKICKCGEE